ncbi:MAG: ferritin-like domain-containing protein [Solirubrobacterales bacterium]|nr:ferritin-like domain-containing protein [Solirubrobacterales bacterium]
MALTPIPNGALDELARDETSRSKFLRMMGGGAAAAGLAGLLAACGDDKSLGGQATGGGVDPGPVAKTGGDIDIVNYALTLEYVEARFYKEVVESGMIKDRKLLELLKQVGETEQTHVETLTEAVKDLGGQPVDAPGTRFEKVIAGGEGQILQVAATVENVGAAAYLGQAARIESKDILAAALSIHTVEARHAAALNEIAGRPFKGGDSLAGTVPDGAFAKPLSMAEVIAAAKPFIA